MSSKGMSGGDFLLHFFQESFSWSLLDSTKVDQGGELSLLILENKALMRKKEPSASHPFLPHTPNQPLPQEHKPYSQWTTSPTTATHYGKDHEDFKVPVSCSTWKKC